ncbi:MAG: CapA family protein [Dethiobacter sp.]|jgi:poly-gamma-glutamate synthesis protein (capsule biosynthesis protein)|nr:CapA family protein [Dethiobacter sp.]
MQNLGIKYIKQSRKNNTVHLAILLILLVSVILSGLFEERAEIVFGMESHSVKDAITVTIGGSYNPSLIDRQKNTVFSGEITRLFANSDLAIISLAAPISAGSAATEKYPVIQQSVKTMLEESKINIVQISNHRIMSHGAVGLLNTKGFLDSNRILQIGAGFSEAEALAPYFFLSEGTTVAVMALNANPPPGWEAGKNRLGVAAFTSDSSRKIVKEASEKSDLLIVLISFSNENTDQQQRNVARDLIEQGAHVVIGTGTGPLKRVETYKQGVIFYNIGNLSSSGSMYSYINESALLRIVVFGAGKAEIKAVPLIAGHSTVRLAGVGYLAYKIKRRLGGSVWELSASKEVVVQ